MNGVGGPGWVEFEEGIEWITGNGKNNLKIKKIKKSIYLKCSRKKEKMNG